MEYKSTIPLPPNILGNSKRVWPVQVVQVTSVDFKDKLWLTLSTNTASRSPYSNLPAPGQAWSNRFPLSLFFSFFFLFVHEGTPLCNRWSVDRGSARALELEPVGTTDRNHQSSNTPYFLRTFFLFENRSSTSIDKDTPEPSACQLGEGEQKIITFLARPLHPAMIPSLQNRTSTMGCRSEPGRFQNLYLSTSRHLEMVL